jgi:hypothetical protein
LGTCAKKKGSISDTIIGNEAPQSSHEFGGNGGQIKDD